MNNRKLIHKSSLKQRLKRGGQMKKKHMTILEASEYFGFSESTLYLSVTEKYRC